MHPSFEVLRDYCESKYHVASEEGKRMGCSILGPVHFEYTPNIYTGNIHIYNLEVLRYYSESTKWHHKLRNERNVLFWVLFVLNTPQHIHRKYTQYIIHPWSFARLSSEYHVVSELKKRVCFSFWCPVQFLGTMNLVYVSTQLTLRYWPCNGPIPATVKVRYHTPVSARYVLHTFFVQGQYSFTVLAQYQFGTGPIQGWYNFDCNGPVLALYSLYVVEFKL